MDAGTAAAGDLSALQTFWNRYAFSVGGAGFIAIDGTLGAMVRGDWPAFELRLAQGLACTARADAEHLTSFDSAVEEAATAFRYERDLISGADVDDWLGRAGLSPEDWMAYITRDVLRREWAADLDEILDRYPSAHRDVAAAAVAEGICSGIFDSFERTLAAHAAIVFDRDPDAFAAALGAGSRNSGERGARVAHLHADWLAIRREDTAARLAMVVSLEDAAATLTDRLASPERLAAMLDANRLDWIQLDFETISFSTEAAAHEAVYCVKEDGMTLSEVAALSHQAVARRQALIDELGADRRDVLVAAEVKQLIGPLRGDDAFDVIVVHGRTAPTLENPRIAVRAREAVVGTELLQAVRAHVSHRPPPQIG
jgi:hypothetical protein